MIKLQSVLLFSEDNSLTFGHKSVITSYVPSKELTHYYNQVVKGTNSIFKQKMADLLIDTANSYDQWVAQLQEARKEKTTVSPATNTRH